MSYDKAKHLELVQGAITRMASNSFLIKGWTITLVAAIFALAAKDASLRFVLVALVPTIFFWGLDAYYLGLEGRFRSLYEVLRAYTPEGIPPSEAWRMKPDPLSVGEWRKMLVRPVILGFYGPLLATVVIVLAWLSAAPLPDRARETSGDRTPTPAAVHPAVPAAPAVTDSGSGAQTSAGRAQRPHSVPSDTVRR